MNKWLGKKTDKKQCFQTTDKQLNSNCLPKLLLSARYNVPL